jgi:signal transduction histidine kinase
MSSRWSEAFRHTLALRLGLWYAALFVISAVALTVVTYARLAHALEQSDRRVLESTLARYAAEYRRAGLRGLTGLIEVDAGEGRHERLLIRLTDDRAELIYFAEPAEWEPFDLAMLDGPETQQSAWSSHEMEDGSVLEVGTLHLGGSVTIQVGRSSHIRDELLENFRARAFEVGAVIALIAVGGGILITYAGLSPLRSLEATVRSIVQTGRFDARVDTSGSRDPLDTFGGLINVMLARIQVLLAGMRGALDNVAHDLRTPLTRFRNVAEDALLSGDQAAMREGLVRAVEEAERVNATLNALIDISEAETGTMRLASAELTLAPVVQEAVALHADEAEDKGLTLATHVPDDLRVVADRTRLRQVLANLIENAVKYTDAGGHIEVEAGTEPGWVVIRVRDTGIGISAQDAPLVWDRLYRADASRSARGLGLGLSLVKAIVEAHRGRVQLSSAPGQGSVFTVMLPA